MPPNQKNHSAQQNTSVASLKGKKLETALKSLLTPDGRPVLVFLAGCNGAGKSELFKIISATMVSPPVFLNADVVAQVLQGIPASDEAAQKVTDLLREHMLGQGTTFVTETVFSDEENAKLNYLKRAAVAGFKVVLVYVSLASVGLSRVRVNYRVTVDNGHDVKSNKLRRRYIASHENARRALAFVEHGLVIDNSDCEEPMRVVATTYKGWRVPAFDTVPPHLENVLPNTTPQVVQQAQDDQQLPEAGNE